MTPNTIQSRLFKSFDEHSERNALEYRGQVLSYAELEERSNVIAHALLAKGLERGTFVSIFMHDKIQLICSVVGIVKSGCVFMPIDVTYPRERIKVMLSTTETKYILTDDPLASFSDIYEGWTEELDIIHVDTQANEFNGKVRPEQSYGPNDKTYVFFTSGSTGNPKAVVGRNESLLHFIEWEIEEFGITQDARVSQFTSPCHNPLLRDIFVPLLSGGAICIPESKEMMLESNSLMEWIESSRVSLIHCTPSLFKLINGKSLTSDRYPQLQYVLLAGERSVPKDIVSWYEIMDERVQLVSLYGQTETTLAKVFHRIKPEDVVKPNIPIGKPISGARVAILNEDLQLCAQGVTGEIYIRTPYRSLGYYNNDELNKERFIPNPFNNDPTDIIYRTGDLGRVLEDGNIEFLGRVDRQIKIRGFRVELNEVENTLLLHPKVKEAAIIAKQNDQGTTYICAYVVLNVLNGVIEPQEQVNHEFRQFIALKLPDYMVPQYFIAIDQLPMSLNGKLDYKALPEPEQQRYIAPADEIESRLAELWCEILGLKQVGRMNRFLESGGHSLNVISLVYKVYQEYNVELPLAEIFKNITLAELADYIRGANSSSDSTHIEPAAEREFYPQSSAQRRMFLLNQLQRNTTSYNIPVVLSLQGKVDKQRLENVIGVLVDRHELLRTTFEVHNNETVQKINNDIKFTLKSTTAHAGEIEQRIEQFVQPFDLSLAPLFRAELIQLAEDQYILMIDMHHIISDGVTVTIMVREFMELYRGNQLSPLNVQYKDYAVWQQEQMGTDSINKQEQYWLQVFEGEIPVLKLATDYPRPEVQTFEGSRLSFTADARMARKVKEIAERTDSTLYMVLLAAYNIMLSKYSGQNDIVVGSPIAGRVHADVLNMTGLFVNTLAMRNAPEGTKTFLSFLQEVRKGALAAYENQAYPFEELVEKLQVRRDINRNPLFDTMFVLQNMEMEKLQLDELDIQAYPFESKIAKFDLTLEAVELEEGIEFQLEYNTNLFKAQTITRMSDHFIHILEAITLKPEQSLREIEMITEEEKRQIREAFNATKAEFPKDKTIQSLFEDQVCNTPDRIALEHKGKQLTYQELNERANQLARTLRSRGVKQDQIVAIMMDRSLEMVISILAVLKAGGAYLPIDPSLPTDRIQYMLRDCGTSILMTAASKQGSIDFTEEWIDVDDEASFHSDNSNLSNSNDAADLVYVIYTSGSTGNPKGVLIENRGLVNYISWAHKEYISSSSEVFALYSSIGFDLTVTSIFTPLISGNQIVIYEDDGEEFILNTILRDNKVNIIKLTPSHLKLLKDMKHANTSVSKLIVGGEDLKVDLAKSTNKAFNNRLKIFNEYGPTETVVGCMIHKYNQSEDTGVSVPIGRPIDNTSIYIVDSNNHFMPVGAIGEICISGAGVARGYLNRPELTAEKFVSNSYASEGVMYKTGDLGRWLSDGSIEYLGRIDDQVKIRGYRIEFGEIEAALQKYPGVKEAAVLAQEDSSGDKSLVAYLVCEEINIAEIRSFLGKELPDYMIPSHYVHLEALPLTSNGKLDQKALSGYSYVPFKSADKAEPVNEMQQIILDIWENILDAQGIGIDDDFFELGGNSLLAFKVEMELEDHIGDLMEQEDISISYLIYKLKTIRKLEVHLTALQESELTLNR
ncbi:amino acid adenylation domain-containing protein [Paenibacillus sp. ALE2]